MGRFIRRLPLIVLYVLQVRQLLIKAVGFVGFVQAAAAIRGGNQIYRSLLLCGVSKDGSPC